MIFKLILKCYFPPLIAVDLIVTKLQNRSLAYIPYNIEYFTTIQTFKRKTPKNAVVFMGRRISVEGSPYLLSAFFGTVESPLHYTNFVLKTAILKSEKLKKDKITVMLTCFSPQKVIDASV